MPAAERKEAEDFGKSPTLFEDILVDCAKRGLMGEHNNAHLIYIAMTSRLRDTPLSVLILSSSGAGKTALQDAVLSFCPPEDLVKLTALSGKALFYKERLSLKHKVLAMEEGDGAEEAMYAIRNLISAGELVSETHDQRPGHRPTHDDGKQGGRPEFRLLHHDPAGRGPGNEKPVLGHEHRRIERPDAEDTLLSAAAASFRRADYFAGDRSDPAQAPELSAIAQTVGRQEPLRRAVDLRRRPAAREKGSAKVSESHQGHCLPSPNAEGNQAGKKQRNRRRHTSRSISTTSRWRIGWPTKSWATASTNFRGPATIFSCCWKRCTTNARRPVRRRPEPIFTCQPERLGVGGFSRRDIREFTGWSNTRLHVHLKELVDFEYIVIETGRNGMPFRYRLAWEGQGKDGKRFMLGLTDPEKLRDPSPGDEAK